MSRDIIKKLMSIILAASFTLLFGCGDTSLQIPEDKADGKIRILCTAYPQYDWVRNITEGAEGVEVSLLLDNGSEMHSFQPAADDIIKIRNSDILVYNGGNSDKALDDIIAQNKGEEQIILNMMHVVSNYLICEDDEAEYTHHTDEKENEHIDCYKADEHIWLSLKNAIVLCEAIGGEMINKDPENKDLYEKNLREYKEKLAKLDREYTSVVNSAKRHEAVVVDRFPFRYLADDYGITCYAAFPGCSTETDASFGTILYLADKLRTLGTDKAIVIEKSSMSVAETVRVATESKHITTCVMNSMQSVTKSDIENGLTYLSVMSENLKVLGEVLND